MKKALYIIIPILVVLVGFGAFFGISFLNSPQYTLWQMSKDVQESGVDGLTPYLTDEAKETVDKITTITDSPLGKAVFGLLGQGGEDGFITKLKDMEWELVDVLAGDGRADVILAFTYDEEHKGQIEMNMVKVDGDWKISGIQLPQSNQGE